MKFSLLDTVLLVEDLPDEGLSAGMVGVVVHIFDVPQEAYEIEFCDGSGETVAQLALLAGQLDRNQEQL